MKTKKLTLAHHRIRLRNLEELIAKRFDGNAVRFAKAIGKAHSYVWQLTHRERRIGEMTARYIEEKLGLGQGFLDRSSEQATVLYQHFGDGRTRTYRLVPRAKLGALDKPSDRAKDRLLCLTPCSEQTIWFPYRSSIIPRFMAETSVFVDKAVRTLEDRALYVVRPKSGPLKGTEMLREARSAEAGFILRSLDERHPPLTPKSVTILGRAVATIQAL